MKIKEIFKSLGYEDFYEDESVIIYSHSFRLRLKEIKFNKLFHSVTFGNNISHDYTYTITNEEIKAIKIQIDELGW